MGFCRYSMVGFTVCFSGLFIIIFVNIILPPLPLVPDQDELPLQRPDVSRLGLNHISNLIQHVSLARGGTFNGIKNIILRKYNDKNDKLTIKYLIFA